MEENKLNKSNKIKVIVLTALLFLIAISGITYAYFSIQIVGNEEASSIRVTTANLKLIYTDTLVMSGEKIYPGWTQTKTITVENAGNQDVYYNIIWRELLNEITNNELVISATCTSSVQGNTCPNISETVIPTETTLTNNISIKKNIGIEVGETHTYVVTVTFKETGSNQNYNQNKQFYGTLNIEEFTPARVTLTTDQGTTGLDTGDLITISQGNNINEQFYVVSTNASETVLLAKYNLLVGDVLDVNNNTYTLNKTLSSLDSGYGLQSSTAKGWVTGSNVQYIGVVPFSGTNYWDNSVCQYTGTSWGCTGASGLKSEYTTNGASYSGNPYPYVYNSNMSSIAPSLVYGTAGTSDGYGHAQNNGYTIAYYVEQYIDTLGINGTGRLLTYEEEQTLAGSNNSVINNGSSYWLGSAGNENAEYDLGSGSLVVNNFAFDRFNGIRPVIVVNTSDISL